LQREELVSIIDDLSPIEALILIGLVFTLRGWYLAMILREKK
jgi:hypothetical protein